MESKIATIIQGHREAFEKSFSEAHLELLNEITRVILNAFKSGNKVLLCGNGGSAADAQHIAAELIARFKRERQSLPAIALTTDTSILTAVGNDYAFADIYARQVEGLGVKGDVLIALSTSGNSPNIIEAVRRATDQGLQTIGFTGGNGGKLQSMVDHCYLAETSDTPHIQEMHITALHAVCEVVEDVLFAS